MHSIGNARRRPKHFKEGDLVMFHAGHFTFAKKGTRKLMPEYLGLFWILGTRGTNAVMLELPNHGNWQWIHNVVNVEYVVPHHKRPNTDNT
jgi:hypothetical protein